MGSRHKRHAGISPAPFVLPERVASRLGSAADDLLTALREPPPVSIRLNPAKPAPIGGTAVPWCATGRYFAERPVFTLDPLLHAGAYYVQEASSMLLEQAVKACAPPAGAIVLDLCSAPGGKATHLAALLPADALLVCNEPVRSRQPVLQENLWKWGRPDTVITGSLPQHLGSLGAFFDLIVVDAPCSGEGMFRKDAFARAQWSERLVESCALQQCGILDAAWDALRPGGHLIYSTCTWEERENEDQARRLMERGAVPVPLPIDPAWGVETSDPGYRCYPHQVKGEGFFLVALWKPGRPVPRVMKGPASLAANIPAVQGWLTGERTLISPSGDGPVHAISTGWAATLGALAAALRTLAPGIPVAQRKGGDWKPHPALALNGSLDGAAFPVLDVDREEALRYLRGEALGSNGTVAEGVRLVRYEGHPLGWAMGAGRRWNNAWPAPWRIRMR